MNTSAVVFQRLDKWLFFSRAIKSRTLAAKHVIAGHVRVNGNKVDDPAKRLQPGDTLTITLERDVRVLQVISPGIRRGPFSEASQLYLDLTPQPTARDPAMPVLPERDAGSGRPTKKDRREFERMRAPET